MYLSGKSGTWMAGPTPWREFSPSRCACCPDSGPWVTVKSPWPPPSLLGPAGTRARGHESHYRKSPSNPAVCPASTASLPGRCAEAAPEGYCLNNILASYVHLHFGSNPEVARSLVAALPGI